MPAGRVPIDELGVAARAKHFAAAGDQSRSREESALHARLLAEPPLSALGAAVALDYAVCAFLVAVGGFAVFIG